VTPLSDEQAGFPEQPVSYVLPPPPPFPPPARMTDSTAAWLEVIKAFGAWLLSVALLLFVPVIVALPYIIYHWANFGPPRPEALGADKTVIFLSIVGILPAHLLTLGLVWWLVTGGGKRPFFKPLGLHWPNNMSPGFLTLLCLLLALVLLAMGWAVTTLWGGSKTQLDLILESSTAARIATALVAVATAPLVEELIYRGLLYSSLERAAGRGFAVVIVSLLFAGVHVFQYMSNIGVILVITLLSFTLTLTRAYTGSVLPPFLIHLVFNGIQSLFIVLALFIDKDLLQKSEEITPTTPGLELAGRLFETIAVYVCRMT
jgi:membrane protease YdiL (CAAX protease family)